MKKTVATVVMLALSVCLCGTVWAQGGKGDGAGKKGHSAVDQADANKDGKVTYEELKAVRPKLTEQKFKEMDKNGDGVLTKADRPSPGEAFDAMLKQADKDKDGKVTYEELKAVRPKVTEERFKAMDLDKDGVLTKADRPKGKPEAGPNPADGAAGKPGGKMKAADVNNDGKVTFEELKAVRPELTQEEFKKMDKDGDGAITKADHKKAK